MMDVGEILEKVAPKVYIGLRGGLFAQFEYWEKGNRCWFNVALVDLSQAPNFCTVLSDALSERLGDPFCPCLWRTKDRGWVQVEKNGGGYFLVRRTADFSRLLLVTSVGPNTISQAISIILTPADT